MMQRYKFSELSRELVETFANLHEAAGIATWLPESLPLTEEEKQFLAVIQKKIKNASVVNLNEATVWSKAIYPLLMMAEEHSLAVWSEFNLKATFKDFILEGIADGVIGTQYISYLAAPFFVVIEAKRGIEAKDPQPQLYGAMLAAAKLNFDENKLQPQIIYGCYTIGDSWTFMRGRVEEIEAEKLTFYVEASRDFIERFEAEIILGILKAIVAKNEQN